ncbi:MAG TPA: VOC family protein [Acidimicrobiales bacterium]|nr:VOC family protein [Acidimicrobiales bacterium]
MATRTSYEQGTPNWVDLLATDPAAARTFYGGLFGWRFEDTPTLQGTSYSMAFLGDRLASAISVQSPDESPVWNTYLAVDDIDAASARAEAAGGKVLMPATDIMDAGRMAALLDPTGAMVFLWQAKQHIGAIAVNEPGAVLWNELMTDDPKKAVAFYGQVVGVGSEGTDIGGTPYTLLTVNGSTVGGVTTPSMLGAPNHWHVYFGTGDVAASVQRATELGATVLSPPSTSPIGTSATLRDPQGAVFSVFKLAEAAPAT